MNTLEPFKEVSDLYTHSSSTKPPLRVALLLTDTFRLNWVASRVIRDIGRSDFAQLELIVRNTRRDDPSRTPGFWGEYDGRPHQHERSALLWRLYRRFDLRVRGTEIDPQEMADRESMLKKVNCLTIGMDAGGNEQSPAEDLAALNAKDLDVLLHFGFATDYDAISKAARFGIWSLHYSDYDYYRGGPPYFWELYERNLLSGLTLILSDELGARRVLAKALFPTELGLSVRRNAARPLWGSSQLVMQKLWELHVFGWDFVRSRLLPSTPYLGKRNNYRCPTNTEILRWFAPEATAKSCKRVVWALTKSKEVLHWQIAIRAGGRYVCGADDKVDAEGFRWLDSPKGHFYADPFVIDRDGQHWIFFEDYHYQDKRGRIACAPVSRSGEMGEVRTVLEGPSHLSYPHVFSDADSLYMIPESGAEGVVRLYRCIDFPQEWTPIADLFHGPAVDTSICQHEGLWWFFTTLKDPHGGGVALYLYYSQSLTGKWQYHPANPISYDVRNARGAGSLFKRESKLIRPSQSGVIRYGYSFALNEVVTLTPSEYEERTILTVEPTMFGDLMATHTYNRAGSIEVIDGQRLTSNSRL